MASDEVDEIMMDEPWKWSGLFEIREKVPRTTVTTPRLGVQG